MGTFAMLFEHGDKGIPDEKTDEFISKIEAVYQNGGMMDTQFFQLYGKNIVTIHKAEMKPNGMDFYYNYFEDAQWENAGFNKKSNHVWSNKIGWSHFHRAVVAAYVLEEQYTDNIAVTMVDGDPVTSWGYIAWLNYLFDEHRHIKNFDTWKLFETFYYLDDPYHSWNDWNKWNDFRSTRYAFISACEIYSIIYGVDNALEHFKNIEKEYPAKQAFDAMESAVEFLQLYFSF